MVHGGLHLSDFRVIRKLCFDALGWSGGQREQQKNG
jgi:hypothetical protein